MASVFQVQEVCVACGRADFAKRGARVLVFCTCCHDLGIHQGCYLKQTKQQLTEDTDYVCSDACRQLQQGLAAARGSQDVLFQVHQQDCSSTSESVFIQFGR